MAERNIREESLVSDGEFVFTAKDFRKIAAMVHGSCGIVLHEGKVNLVYSRLAKRLRAIGLRSFREYCALLESDAGADERQAMIAAMTTNVTRFFREPHHFDYLKSTVMPGIAADAAAGKRVRIWSAGCSSGEEPYSIALSVLESIPDVAQRDVLILATDIDPNMVARGRAGIYSAQTVTNIPAELRRKWIVSRGKGADVHVAGAARALVRFNELNLHEDWPMTGKFRAIFCRNVMIYFDEEAQNRIWARFAHYLEPGGILFIGHSERIATDLHPFELVAQTTYRLKQGAKI